MSLTDDQIAWLQRNRGMSGGSADTASSQPDQSADPNAGQPNPFDADAFYQQTLQTSGYTIGGDPCLDQCWTDFQACLNKPGSNAQQCLAQLSVCQRSCGQQQQTSSASGSTGDQPTTTAADPSGAAATGAAATGSAGGDGSSADGQSGGTSAGTTADNASGATPAFDADSFYQQTLQSSGYTLGGHPCLDKCWADFQACLKTTNDPNQCLAQLTACQRSCGQQQQTSSDSGSTGDQPTTTAADPSSPATTTDGGGGMTGVTPDGAPYSSQGTTPDSSQPVIAASADGGAIGAPADAGAPEVVLTSGGQANQAGDLDAPPLAATDSTVFFSRNSSDLTPSDKASLQTYVDRYVAAATPTPIVLKGYASVDGDATVNVKLAQKRADAVKAFMAATIKAELITAAGQGPTAQFQNGLAAANRRVDFGPPVAAPTAKPPAGDAGGAPGGGTQGGGTQQGGGSPNDAGPPPQTVSTKVNPTPGLSLTDKQFTDIFGADLLAQWNAYRSKGG